MSKQVLGYYINNENEIKTVVQKQGKTFSYVNSESNKETEVSVKTLKKTQVVSELKMKKNKESAVNESESFTLYPDIDTLWFSMKVEE